ncbi:MAG: tubulin-like doman-containing protein, partial [bacterium]
MLIDIAYYLRHLFGLWAYNYKNRLSTNIQGIFTVLDEKLLSRAGMPDIDKWAANCYSSLTELDFFSHPSSLYEVLFPDGIRISSNDTPYDYLYVLSCSGQGGTFWKEDGSSPDLPGLNHMIAMVLFTEAVSDLYSRKEEIRTDFRSFANAGIPNENEHLPFFASCGISCVWYPKYRITRAVACQMAGDLCRKWQGDPSFLDNTTINYEASKLWQTLLDTHITILTKKPGASIENEIKEKFDKQILNISRDDIVKIIENIGIKDILTSFKENGENDEVIKNQLAIFKKTFLDEVREIISQRINKTTNLSEVRAFLISLDREIEKTISSLPLKYPIISSLFLDEILQKAKPSIFAIFGKKEEKKRRVLDEVYNYILSLLRQIRGFRVRPVLGEIREILGCSIANKEIPSLKDEIDRAIEKMQVTMERLKEETEKELTLPKMQSIEVIANNPKNSILEDVEILKGRLSALSSHKWKMLLNKIFAIDEGRKMELSDLLLLSVDEIMLKMTSPFQIEALEAIK